MDAAPKVDAQGFHHLCMPLGDWLAIKLSAQPLSPFEDTNQPKTFPLPFPLVPCDQEGHPSMARHPSINKWLDLFFLFPFLLLVLFYYHFCALILLLFCCCLIIYCFRFVTHCKMPWNRTVKPLERQHINSINILIFPRTMSGIVLGNTMPRTLVFGRTASQIMSQHWLTKKKKSTHTTGCFPNPFWSHFHTNIQFQMCAGKWCRRKWKSLYFCCLHWT